MQNIFLIKHSISFVEKCPKKYLELAWGLGQARGLLAPYAAAAAAAAAGAGAVCLKCKIHLHSQLSLGLASHYPMTNPPAQQPLQPANPAGNFYGLLMRI